MTCVIALSAVEIAQVTERERQTPSGFGPESEQLVDTTRLFVKARDGDRETLNALCDRLLPRLRSWAAGRLPADARSISDTNDLVQEAIAGTLPKLSSISPPTGGAVCAYLRQAILNRIRDEVRSAARRPRAETLPSDPEAPGPSPLQQAIGREDLRRYDAALAKLKSVDREAIIGRLELGLGFGELAAALGKPTPDAARMTVNRAVLRLAEEMGNANRR
jgi:RNA polymerase sigma-70 factor (ECF subfamily)